MQTFSQPKAWILDVGHGNATIVEASGHVFVIDGGRQGALLRFLEERKITCIDTVIVSHVDADHLGGISLLLGDIDFQVKQVYLNPDRKGTALWRDFASIMTDARGRGTEFYLELTQINPGQLASGGIQLDILAPSQELATRTTDHLNPVGRRLDSNAMSAVVRVGTDDLSRILLTGDIDQIGLDYLMENNASIEADILVFPHHGGHPGRSDPVNFAQTLIQAVGAQLVVFSIGRRGRHRMPLPEIVNTVRSHGQDVHIACTQLSKHCTNVLPSMTGHLHAVFAQGATGHECCAGTLEISFESKETYVPTRAAHIDFIAQHVPAALCQQR